MGSGPLAAPGALAQRAASLLAELIRFDTQNPPGGEREAQQHLQALLAEAGLESELLARDPSRPNLLARLAGERQGPTLCLLGHVDVVPAEREGWRHDPFGGAIVDGEVWGRGAQDMKGQVAAELAAVLELAEHGWRPARGELLVVLTADEEAGAAYGARWLCEAHPERVRCDYVVNEGGGPSFTLSGRRFYPVCVGEKGVARLALRTRGRAGHASLPRVGDNALIKLAPLLDALAAAEPPPEDVPEAGLLLRALLGDDGGEATDGTAIGSALRRLRELEPRLADLLVEPMASVTLVPTMAEASRKANVIPDVAEVLVDCRVPPGAGAEQALRRAREALGDHDYELEAAETVVGTRSEPEGPLMRALSGWAEQADPEAALVPSLLPGFSDSHWFRSAFGAVAYGFFPQRTMDLLTAAPLVHARDERVAVDDLGLAASCYVHVCRELLG